MSKQVELWCGPFGDAYQERNKLTTDEVAARETFLEHIAKSIFFYNRVLPTSVFEIGAGQGPNMMALDRLAIKIMQPMKLFATEINAKANIALRENIPTCTVLDEIPNHPIADLVMTYGVLIHTHPAHVRHLMEKMYKASNRWILMCEYFAPQTRPIPYHGETDALWLDDYGRIFMDNFKVAVVAYGFQWKKMTQLDNITYWVFEKKEKMQ